MNRGEDTFNSSLHRLSHRFFPPPFPPSEGALLFKIHYTTRKEIIILSSSGAQNKHPLYFHKKLTQHELCTLSFRQSVYCLSRERERKRDSIQVKMKRIPRFSVSNLLSLSLVLIFQSFSFLPLSGSLSFRRLLRWERKNEGEQSSFFFLFKNRSLYLSFPSRKKSPRGSLCNYTSRKLRERTERSHSSTPTNKNQVV